MHTRQIGLEQRDQHLWVQRTEARQQPRREVRPEILEADQRELASQRLSIAVLDGHGGRHVEDVARLPQEAGPCRSQLQPAADLPTKQALAQGVFQLRNRQ
ncbi:hypothetical protein D9M68_993440 [compost metagenome]